MVTRAGLESGVAPDPHLLIVSNDVTRMAAFYLGKVVTASRDYESTRVAERWKKAANGDRWAWLE